MNEATLYTLKSRDNVVLIVSLYVDDLLVTRRNEKALCKFKLKMQKEFDMTDLGPMRYFLSLEIQQLKNGIWLSHKGYISKVLKRFHMGSCKPVTTPQVANVKFFGNSGKRPEDPSIYRKLIGCLLYICSFRPDIMYTVRFLS